MWPLLSAAKEVQFFHGLGVYSGIFTIYLQCPSNDSRTRTSNVVFYTLPTCCDQDKYTMILPVGAIFILFFWGGVSETSNRTQLERFNVTNFLKKCHVDFVYVYYIAVAWQNFVIMTALTTSLHAPASGTFPSNTVSSLPSLPNWCSHKTVTHAYYWPIENFSAGYIDEFHLTFVRVIFSGKSREWFIDQW